MVFLDPTNTSHTTPPALVIYPGTGLFILSLDTTWTFPTYINWQLQYATSVDGLTYNKYISDVVATTYHYTYINIDPALYYKFRYIMHSKSATSLPSAEAYAGRVKIGVIDPATGGWAVGEINV